MPRLLIFVFLMLLTPLASAEDPVEEPEAAEEEPEEEVIVYGDRFKRWDGTRWFVKTELVSPHPFIFKALKNKEFDSHAMQVRTIIACEKEWKLSRKRYEVLCSIEDIGIVSASDDSKTTEKERETIKFVLTELHDRLMGASLQLQVLENGRVVGLDIEGFSANNEREVYIFETARQLLSRVVTGFDMRLQRFNELREKVWTEYSSQLMTMPTMSGASGGNSILVHRLRRFDDLLLVDSAGKGVIAVGEAMWSAEMTGVAAYSRKDGYMTERVWFVQALPTASIFSANAIYRHGGRMVQLDPDQKPSVGPTEHRSPPGKSEEGVPSWIVLED